MLIIVVGLPGSGKTYFAVRLAELIGAQYIGSDRTRRQLYANRTYSDGEKNSVYEAMLLQVQAALQRQQNVVADGTFYQRKIRQRFVKAASTVTTVFFIEVIADESVIKKRLAEKREDSEADIEVYNKIKTQWQVLTEPHLILQSTDTNIDQLLQQAACCLHLNNEQPANR